METKTMSEYAVSLGLSEETVKKYGDPYDYTHPVNQESGERQQTRSVWSFGGWYSNSIDAAMRHDDADGLLELMRLSELDRSTTTLDGLTMEQYAEKRGAEKCKAAISALR